MPTLRTLARKEFATTAYADSQAWRASVLALWRGAVYREERYAAVVLARLPRYRGFRDLRALPMYEELIVTGAWWDFVDEIAVNLIGELLRNHPKPLRATLRRWSKDADLWRRRSAILAQLKFKQETDAPLLFALIEPSLSSREFFLRKAIGWALREYAKSAPDAVRRYIAMHDAQLSALSKREALRRIGAAT